MGDRGPSGDKGVAGKDVSRTFPVVSYLVFYPFWVIFKNTFVDCALASLILKTLKR